jgi:hypothetical protein
MPKTQTNNRPSPPRSTLPRVWTQTLYAAPHQHAVLPKRSPYVHLLEEDETFLRWYENAKRGSQTYASVCFRRIGNICREYATTPSDLARKNPKEVTSFLIDMVSMLEARGNAGTLIESYIKALKSWFSFNDIVVTKKIRIPYTPNKYENEKTPSPDELNRILNHADLRAKAACSLIAFSGIRPEVMGTIYGADGLKLGDFPELEFHIAQKSAAFTKVPAKLVIRRPISKSKRSYFTFIPEQACEYIREYLEAQRAEATSLSWKCLSSRT